jgi:hypothetical protein
MTSSSYLGRGGGGDLARPPSAALGRRRHPAWRAVVESAPEAGVVESAPAAGVVEETQEPAVSETARGEAEERRGRQKRGRADPCAGSRVGPAGQGRTRLFFLRG